MIENKVALGLRELAENGFDQTKFNELMNSDTNIVLSGLKLFFTNSNVDFPNIQSELLSAVVNVINEQVVEDFKKNKEYAKLQFLPLLKDLIDNLNSTEEHQKIAEKIKEIIIKNFTVENFTRGFEFLYVLDKLFYNKKLNTTLNNMDIEILMGKAEKSTNNVLSIVEHINKLNNKSEERSKEIEKVQEKIRQEAEAKIREEKIRQEAEVKRREEEEPKIREEREEQEKLVTKVKEIINSIKDNTFDIKYMNDLETIITGIDKKAENKNNNNLSIKIKEDNSKLINKDEADILIKKINELDLDLKVKAELIGQLSFFSVNNEFEHEIKILLKDLTLKEITKIEVEFDDTKVNNLFDLEKNKIEIIQVINYFCESFDLSKFEDSFINMMIKKSLEVFRNTYGDSLSSSKRIPISALEKLLKNNVHTNIEIDEFDIMEIYKYLEFSILENERKLEIFNLMEPLCNSKMKIMLKNRVELLKEKLEVSTKFKKQNKLSFQVKAIESYDKFKERIIDTKSKLIEFSKYGTEKEIEEVLSNMVDKDINHLIYDLFVSSPKLSNINKNLINIIIKKMCLNINLDDTDTASYSLVILSTIASKAIKTKEDSKIISRILDEVFNHNKPENENTMLATSYIIMNITNNFTIDSNNQDIAEKIKHVCTTILDNSTNAQTKEYCLNSLKNLGKAKDIYIKLDETDIEIIMNAINKSDFNDFDKIDFYILIEKFCSDELKNQLQNEIKSLKEKIVNNDLDNLFKNNFKPEKQLEEFEKIINSADNLGVKCEGFYYCFDKYPLFLQQNSELTKRIMKEVIEAEISNDINIFRILSLIKGFSDDEKIHKELTIPQMSNIFKAIKSFNNDNLDITLKFLNFCNNDDKKQLLKNEMKTIFMDNNSIKNILNCLSKKPKITDSITDSIILDNITIEHISSFFKNYKDLSSINPELITVLVQKATNPIIQNTDDILVRNGYINILKDFAGRKDLNITIDSEDMVELINIIKNTNSNINSQIETLLMISKFCTDNKTKEILINEIETIGSKKSLLELIEKDFTQEKFDLIINLMNTDKIIIEKINLYFKNKVDLLTIPTNMLAIITKKVVDCVKNENENIKNNSIEILKNVISKFKKTKSNQSLVEDIQKKIFDIIENSNNNNLKKDCIDILKEISENKDIKLIINEKNANILITKINELNLDNKAKLELLIKFVACGINNEAKNKLDSEIVKLEKEEKEKEEKEREEREEKEEKEREEREEKREQEKLVTKVKEIIDSIKNNTFDIKYMNDLETIITGIDKKAENKNNNNLSIKIKEDNSKLINKDEADILIKKINELDLDLKIKAELIGQLSFFSVNNEVKNQFENEIKILVKTLTLKNIAKGEKEFGQERQQLEDRKKKQEVAQEAAQKKQEAAQKEAQKKQEAAQKAAQEKLKKDQTEEKEMKKLVNKQVEEQEKLAKKIEQKKEDLAKKIEQEKEELAEKLEELNKKETQALERLNKQKQEQEKIYNQVLMNQIRKNNPADKMKSTVKEEIKEQKIKEEKQSNISNKEAEEETLENSADDLSRILDSAKVSKLSSKLNLAGEALERENRARTVKNLNNLE